MIMMNIFLFDDGLDLDDDDDDVKKEINQSILYGLLTGRVVSSVKNFLQKQCCSNNKE